MQLWKRPPEELEALSARFDRPGPRYTSYPTAAQFTGDVGPDQALRALRQAACRPLEPLSAYVHVPFCARRCAYCACEVIPSVKGWALERYLGQIEREMKLVAEALGGRRALQALHLGGGTPTSLSPEQLDRLFEALHRRFPLLPGAEVSVELDPRVTSREHLRSLRKQGVTRVSLGVQDFDLRVQRAIGRNQTPQQALECFRQCREAGFPSINLDLVYGLPAQSLESMGDTVDQVLLLRPERVAMYGYAHVPWMRPHQKEIDPSSLPRAGERLGLFSLARERLVEAGYVPIGMDHFALPGDELAEALRARRLGRNFMGYTPHRSLEVLGLGVSSVSSLGGVYYQNTKTLAAYGRLPEEGRLPVERGCAWTRDDAIRRFAIQEVLCHQEISFDAFLEEAGVPFSLYFRPEEPELGELDMEGLLQRAPEGISITPLGRYFLRNVAMVFDRYTRTAHGETTRYSRTV